MDDTTQDNTTPAQQPEAEKVSETAGFESVSEETFASLGIEKQEQLDDADKAPAEQPAESETKDDKPEAEKESKKSRYQRRIDELVADRENSKIELEKMRKQMDELRQQSRDAVDTDKPKSASDFDTYDEYLEYLDDFESKTTKKERKQAWDDAHQPDKGDTAQDTESKSDKDEPLKLTSEQQVALARVKEKFESIENLPADFNQIAFGEYQMTGAMLEALAECDNPDKVAYYLGKNPAEADKIASASVAQQMRSIVNLELKLSNPPRPQQKFSSAPDPITPVGTNDATQKSLDKVSFNEYESRRSEQQKQEYNGGW